MPRSKPDVAFWGRLGDFMRETMLTEGAISPEDAEFIHTADAVHIIQERHAGMLSSAPEAT
jgi:predicted Rossmann-fold nucleotide-binding protein